MSWPKEDRVGGIEYGEHGSSNVLVFAHRRLQVCEGYHYIFVGFLCWRSLITAQCKLQVLHVLFRDDMILKVDVGQSDLTTSQSAKPYTAN
eukprot:606286-Amorphochlora_amoeboformis.AAC.1